MDTFETTSQIIFNSKQKNIIDPYSIYSYKKHNERGFELFNKTIFENICKNHFELESYSRTLSILFNTHSRTPLEKCILLSVALETISSLIKKKKSNTKPINEANLKNSDLINKLIDLIKSDQILTETEKAFLIDKKIKYLNNPTNTDKTVEAFRSYNIKLTDHLHKVIKYRDNYLHGNIPKKEQFGFEIDNATRAFELQLLVSILLLKYSGYKGYVLNKAAIIEYNVSQ